MNKIIVKTESVEEFLARGGKINKINNKGARKTYIKKVMSTAELDDADYSELPMALKIKYGIKD